MALFGSIATVRAQAPRTPTFEIAFQYVDELIRTGSGAHTRLRSLARGDAQKVDLGLGVFAVEQVYGTKARADGFFESHRKYIDLQVIAEGEELMEVIEASRIAVNQPYLEERDLITYRDTPDASLLRLVAGQAAVFYPVDVHMPSLRLGASGVLVQKSVVKIPVA